jgi:hypothetical protein
LTGVEPRAFQVSFDCASPLPLATFWAAVLGYTTPATTTGFDEWCRIDDPTAAGPSLFFHAVSEPKIVKNRVHLDVHVHASSNNQQAIDAEVDRVMSLGARKVRAVTDEAGYFVVMLDPEGNEFCID